MKEKEKTSPYPILSVNGRKGESGEQKRIPIYSSSILGEVGRGNGLSRGTGRKAFTLVELIIVITILAILATIAFISFQGYTSKSRDANRASTAKNIETGLSVFQAKSGVYPIQSTGGTISLSGTKITVQGNLDESIARVINLSEVPRDPKTGEMYHYISDTAGKGGKVLYYLENTPEYAFLTQSFAESEVRTPIVKGEGPGVVLDLDKNLIEEDIDFFGDELSGSYIVVVDNTTEVTGSGLELGGGFQMFALKGGRLEAPKTCPTGFIPVPGNAEFLQPGFCVAKYEMALERDLVGTGELNSGDKWNTWSGSSTSRGTGTVWEDGKIVSAPGKYPIARITQIQAIAACKSLGGTTHLITNNEWMTIARDIEANAVNWSSGQVGSGYIFNGVSDGSKGSGSGTTKIIYSGSLTLHYDRATKTGPGGNANCDEKRQLKLSNGEVIWDLVGNVWEHVNKANTKDGENFNVGKFKFDDDRGHWNISNSGANNEYYSWHKIGWSASAIPEEIRKKYGPSKSNYSHTNNGVGNIYGWKLSYEVQPHNIIRRGGSANNIDDVGLYALTLWWTSNDSNHIVGFRCAY